MKIRPYIGFGKIKFGLTENEVIQELDEPTYREATSYPDETDEITLYYENLGLRLGFSSEDNFRLGSITFLNNSYTLFGISYVGKEEAFLLNQYKINGLEDLILDDDFSELKSKDYCSDKHGLSFWIQEGQIYSLTIFPKYDTV